jgi:hypothetical protein
LFGREENPNLKVCDLGQAGTKFWPGAPMEKHYQVPLFDWAQADLGITSQIACFLRKFNG